MRDSIYICAASLCICLVACALLRILTPSGSTRKIMSLVVGVFMLCCMLSPIASLVKGFDIKESDSSFHLTGKALETTYNSEVLKATGDYINEYIRTMLKEAGVKVRDIKTIIGTSEDRGIYVRSVSIYIDKGNNEEIKNIKELITTAVGVEPQIFS